MGFRSWGLGVVGWELGFGDWGLEVWGWKAGISGLGFGVRGLGLKSKRLEIAKTANLPYVVLGTSARCVVLIAWFFIRETSLPPRFTNAAAMHAPLPKLSLKGTTCCETADRTFVPGQCSQLLYSYSNTAHSLRLCLFPHCKSERQRHLFETANFHVGEERG